MAEKKKRRSLNTFVILLVVLLAVSIVTWIASGQTYTGFDRRGRGDGCAGRFPQRHPDGSPQWLA